jgi:hypothetical protein
MCGIGSAGGGELPVEPTPNYRRRTQQHLREIVQDAAGEPPLVVPLELREAGPNAADTLIIRWRCHPRLPEPDECQRAILELLYVKGRTRHRDVVRTLRDAFTVSTLERRLRGLVKLGVINKSTRPPRGYDLDPLLRLHADGGQLSA